MTPTNVHATVTLELDVNVSFSPEEITSTLLSIGKDATEEQAIKELVLVHVSSLLRGKYASRPGDQSPEEQGVQVTSMHAERLA
jgi:hypothetical protein